MYRYPIKINWEPDFDLGMTMEWNYTNKTVTLSMSGYVKEALLKFQRACGKVKCPSPSPYTTPQYGIKVQLAKIDESEPMNNKQTKLLQQVCRTFLYYARAVDCTMLNAPNDLETKVKNGKQQTAKALTRFLNYFAANPDSKVTYRASDMILHNHSDTSYLVASEAQSRAGGFTFLGNKEDNTQIINGPIAIIAKIIKVVMASAAEAEVGALYMNAQALIPLQIMCEE